MRHDNIALPSPATKSFALEAALVETRRALNRYDSEERYNLIVSLHVPETDVDLLTPVKSKVAALITGQIEITP
ncbi:hypothetical protein [Enterobacter sp. UPMP2052]